jgi:hypothetical protein
MKASVTHTLLFQCQSLRLPVPSLEVRFHPTRKWRFDVAWIEAKVAVEIHGGAFVSGRHTRGAGFREDCVKLATAAALGWRVIPCLPEHIVRGEAIGWIEAALNGAA